MTYLKRLNRTQKIALLVGVLALAAAVIFILTGRGGGGTDGAEGDVLYHCPMHPTYTSYSPDDKCPICGMDLVPVKEEGADDEKSGHASPEGLADITLSQSRRQLLGIRTVEASVQPMTTEIRTVGTVQAAEDTLDMVNMKIDGYIEDLHVNQTGQYVQKGQALVSIYSEELYAAQQEYLVALRSRSRLKNSAYPEISGSMDRLVTSARRRLQLWDIPESAINQLERTGKPQRTITLRSPASGYVMERTATQGAFVRAGEPLFQIADLSRVWVIADVYEYELDLVRPGTPAVLTVEAYPEQRWQGQVDYVYPVLNAESRTAKARFTFRNPGLRLKPNMFANVVMRIAAGNRLSVPEEAVVDTGKRQIVFLARGEGRYSPREVRVGRKSEDRVEILSGLSAGDEVVVDGNFMLDSESRLKAALSDMDGSTEDQDASGAGGSSHDH